MSLRGKISVCLLTYNHANLIETTLQSVLEQSCRDFELIVSDDCSTDGTWDRILATQQRDPRIRAIRTPRNLGMAANANHAVEHASGSYIALLHHDDLYRHDLLEKWSAMLDEHGDIEFVFNSYTIHGTGQLASEDIPSGKLDGIWLLQKYLLPRWGCPVRGTAMIRKSRWERVGGMRTQFGLLADVDLWMRLSMMGPVGYVNEPLISVRQERPDDYPDIYKGEHWSWRRLTILYAIHASNRLVYLASQSWWKRSLAWCWFRIRLSSETSKWIAYAIVRGNRGMIRNVGESETPWDLFFLRVFRSLASHFHRAPRGSSLP